MGTMKEQKLINAVGYEPFVLSTCKSAPMRTASKLPPDSSHLQYSVARYKTAVYR
ncbi:hypothetical protein LguiB_026650 [Lonicera macranthoides]